MNEIWNEPGGQRLFSDIKPGGKLVIYITEQYYPEPPAWAILYSLNKNTDLLIGQDDQGLLRICIETTRRSPTMTSTELVPITPRLAAWLVDKWGYVVKFDRKGYVIRTTKGCTKAIPTLVPMGRL